MKRAVTITLALSVVSMMVGCGDPIDRLLAGEEQRHQLIDRIVARGDVSTDLVNHLLEADSTRAMSRPGGLRSK